MRLWDVATRTLRHTLSRASAPISFSPDSKTLAAESGGGVRLWDVATGEPLKTFQGRSVRDNVCFSGDGQTLLVQTWSYVHLYDVETGRLRHIVHPPYFLYAPLVCSPDGQTFITTGEGEVDVWDIATGALRNTFGPAFDVNSVWFSPDSQTLASVSPSDETVRLWDVSIVFPFLRMVRRWQVGAMTGQ